MSFTIWWAVERWDRISHTLNTYIPVTLLVLFDVTSEVKVGVGCVLAQVALEHADRHGVGPEVYGEAHLGLEREGALVADEQFPGLSRFLLQFLLVILVPLRMLRPHVLAEEAVIHGDVVAAGANYVWLPDVAAELGGNSIGNFLA